MSLFSKFKNNLKKTSNILSSNILNSLKGKKVDDKTLEELESVLISADVSLDVANKLIDTIRAVKSTDENITNIIMETLATEIETILKPKEKKLFEQDEKENKILRFI